MDAGPSREVERGQLDISRRQLALAEGEQASARELRGLTMPGLKTAIDYYTRLSSGDPGEIQRSIAPAAEMIAGSSKIAKERITAEMPRGGEQRLAEEMVDANQAAQTGRLGVQAYTSSFPALAAMAGQGIGLSLNQMANAIAGYGGAANTMGNVGQQQAAGKASTMGFLGSLASAGGAVGAAAACWIAEELFGVNDARTILLRKWVSETWPQRSLVGKLAFGLYLKHGRKVAKFIQDSPAARAVCAAIFSLALRQARKEVMFVQPKFATV